MSAILFAMGSTLFSYLLLRGRTVPVPLAWIGVVASLLLVVGLPLARRGPQRPCHLIRLDTNGRFEVRLSFWLLIKGVSTQTIR
jgi:hypothetical protein